MRFLQNSDDLFVRLATAKDFQGGYDSEIELVGGYGRTLLDAELLEQLRLPQELAVSALMTKLSAMLSGKLSDERTVDQTDLSTETEQVSLIGITYQRRSVTR